MRPEEYSQPESSAVSLEEVSITYGLGLTKTTPISGISLSIPHGATMGIVGESGSGKSTIAKALVRRIPIASGVLKVSHQEFRARSRKRFSNRRSIQLIPQSPFSSLDPRRTVDETLAEALEPTHAGIGRLRQDIAKWLDLIQLPSDAGKKLPGEFSGGQLQRIAIARALCVEPEIVVADEITSALDASIQRDILDLVNYLKSVSPFTLVFISHDIGVVNSMCRLAIVLRSGSIVEQGSTEEVFGCPKEPYTRQLLDSIPGSPGFRIRRRV